MLSLAVPGTTVKATHPRHESRIRVTPGGSVMLVRTRHRPGRRHGTDFTVHPCSSGPGKAQADGTGRKSPSIQQMFRVLSQEMSLVGQRVNALTPAQPAASRAKTTHRHRAQQNRVLRAIFDGDRSTDRNCQDQRPTPYERPAMPATLSGVYCRTA